MTIRSVKVLHLDEMQLQCPAGDDQFMVPQSFMVSWETTFDDGTILRRIVQFPSEKWRTDLASVPPAFWMIVPPHRRIKRAAVVHDGLYQWRPILEGGRITREEADHVLRAICLLDGIGEIEAEEVFRAVRIGGGIYWHRHDAYFARLDASKTA